ncbi:hypothetical protein [Prescottella equi]|jgi:hypothetical protein|uniref:hypothetical protein n=1 Tax=Rhodococcus hoagii TaxID=43767 RepID=UPI003B803778
MGKKITRGLVLAAAAAGVTLASVGVAQAAPTYYYGVCTPIQGGVTTLQPGQTLCTTDNGQPGARWVLTQIMTQGGVTSN